MIRIIITLLFVVMVQPLFSQASIQMIMDSVAANNMTLKADRQYYEAQKMNARTGIYLANPSVSFDRLGNSSDNYSEMVVSQSFDFPTAYAHKSKIASLSATQYGERLRQSELEILTVTVQVYAELVHVNRKISILTEQLQMTDKLQSGIEKRLAAGDANIFEANRVKSERVKVQSELQITQSRRESLLLKLAGLNGGKPIAVNDTIFPLTGFTVSDSSTVDMTDQNPQVRQWETEAQIAERNINLQKSLSLPRFEIGYRQDNSAGQMHSGFHAGITIPLFENKNTVKSAKARQIYATDAVNAYKLELQSDIEQLVTEYKALQQSITGINQVFSTLNTPRLLLKAYTAGQISYTEFFTEYGNYQQTNMYIEELSYRAAALQFQLYVLTVN